MALVASSLLGSSLSAAVFTWVASDGNWTSTNVGSSGNSNWTSGGIPVNTVPNSTSDDAIFDQAGTASVSSAININTLNLNDTGAQINVLQTSLTTAGDVNNGGTINLLAASSFRTASLNVGGTLNNTGTIQYSRFSGTNLTLAANVNNSGNGLISIADNVRVNFNKTDGVLNNDAALSIGTGASFNFSSGESYTQTTNATLTNNGSLNIGAGASFNLNGGNTTGNAILISDGNINFGAGSSHSNASFTAQRATTWTGDIGSGTQIHVQATSNNATFSHDGDVINAGMIEVESSLASFRAAKLTVGTGNTLTNTGELIFRSVNGTASTLTFEGNLDNQGQVTFESGQTTSFSDTDATHINSGTITLESGATLSLATNISQNERTTFLNEASGRIEGSGNFNSGSAVFGNNGTLAPGNSAGELTVTGDLGLGATSILEIEIGGRSASTEYDVLTVNGDLSLDGDLDVSFLSSFYQDINSGDIFSIVYADSINGSFDNLDVNNRVITSDGRGSFFVAIGGTTIVLEQFELIAIPEPSSFALFLALSSTLTLYKRKRKR